MSQAVAKFYLYVQRNNPYIMMANFEKWAKAFRNQNLFEFNFNENALMWLKVRAVCRGKLIQQFLKYAGITLTSSKIAEQNVELFVILVDSANMNESWKMKRAFSLIEPQVKNYLDNFNEQSLKEINFVFQGKPYKSLADVIFVVK